MTPQNISRWKLGAASAALLLGLERVEFQDCRVSSTFASAKDVQGHEGSGSNIIADRQRPDSCLAFPAGVRSAWEESDDLQLASRSLIVRGLSAAPILGRTLRTKSQPRPAPTKLKSCNVRIEKIVDQTIDAFCSSSYTAWAKMLQVSLLAMCCLSTGQGLLVHFIGVDGCGAHSLHEERCGAFVHHFLTLPSIARQ
eukprot:scaffold310129_cov33-Prasinocladus_malaysianus.AAC.1